MKKHKLNRLISSKVNNQPLLITENKLQDIVSYLEERDEPSLGIIQEETERKEKILTDDLAMIPLYGSLSYEKSFLNALCGMTSYQQLLEDVEEALSLGIKTIVFDADSGGGEAYAMMSTAKSIRERVDEADAEIITYVDGTCASACFGLAAISDQIIAHPDSQIGSVGVVVRLVDDTEYKKQNGYKEKYITSADSKVPFDEDGGFKESFLQDIQESVDDLHKKFVEHISNYRGMSLEDVDSTEAKVFNADRAMEVGFIDSVMDHDAFFTYLEERKEKEMPLNVFNKKAKDNPETLNLSVQEEKEKMQLEEMQTKLETANAEKDEALSQLADAQEKMSSYEEQVKELNSQLEEAQTELSDMAKAKEEAKMESRKEKLSDVLPSDRVEAIFEATKSMEDSAFETILAGYEADAKRLEKSEMFQEKGVDAEAEATEEEVSSVMNLIKAQKQSK